MINVACLFIIVYTAVGWGGGREGYTEGLIIRLIIVLQLRGARIGRNLLIN